MTRTIYHSGEYWALHNNGCIERPGLVKPSEQWRIVGAVTLNNFGRETRYYSAGDVLHNPDSIPWKHANGKQKTFILDLDHGNRRMWTCSHKVY
jgi:hypothetical protein